MKLWRLVTLLSVWGGRRLLRGDRRETGVIPSAPKHRRWIEYTLVLGAAAAIAGLLGALVLVSGAVPIKASSGHWPITAWVLNFAKSRSVWAYSIGIEAPDLTSSALIRKGASHYETGCAPCHGSPELRYPWIAMQSTPSPPNLMKTVTKWAPEELFYIVKHGIKFTGMPAWPALGRDDEVWAVTAFLMKLPGMDAPDYRSLIQELSSTESAGDPDPASTPLEPLEAGESNRVDVVGRCVNCHGSNGLGVEGAFPRLAGQREDYLQSALRGYASADRHSGIMGPIAGGLSERERRQLARYYASLPALSTAQESGQVAIGMDIATRGIASRLIPPCSACHGPSPTRLDSHFPILSGQEADYLVLQLELFQRDVRGGSEYSHLMQPIASRLTAEEREAVAQYYASLTP